MLKQVLKVVLQFMLAIPGLYYWCILQTWSLRKVNKLTGSNVIAWFPRISRIVAAPSPPFLLEFCLR
jgi:hypothetical protein